MITDLLFNGYVYDVNIIIIVTLNFNNEGLFGHAIVSSNHLALLNSKSYLLFSITYKLNICLCTLRSYFLNLKGLKLVGNINIYV